jgi:hypothetical protein
VPGDLGENFVVPSQGLEGSLGDLACQALQFRNGHDGTRLDIHGGLLEPTPFDLQSIEAPRERLGRHRAVRGEIHQPLDAVLYLAQPREGSMGIRDRLRSQALAQHREERLLKRSGLQALGDPLADPALERLGGDAPAGSLAGAVGIPRVPVVERGELFLQVAALRAREPSPAMHARSQP